MVHTPASHRYPVASNGKLLDVAVIGESAQSTQVSTQKPQSDSDVEVLGVTKQTQHTRKVMGKDRGLLECPKCSSRHASDPRWVYCPKCFVVIHKTCLLIIGCICKYRLMQWTFSFLSSRVRLVYKLSVPQKWGLFTICRFLKSEACLQTVGSSKVRFGVFISKVSCHFDIVFCMNDLFYCWLSRYIIKISVINYIFSCFLLQLRWGLTVRKRKITANKGA